MIQMDGWQIHSTEQTKASTKESKVII